MTSQRRCRERMMRRGCHVVALAGGAPARRDWRRRCATRAEADEAPDTAMVPASMGLAAVEGAPEAAGRVEEALGAPVFRDAMPDGGIRLWMRLEPGSSRLEGVRQHPDGVRVAHGRAWAQVEHWRGLEGALNRGRGDTVPAEAWEAWIGGCTPAGEGAREEAP